MLYHCGQLPVLLGGNRKWICDSFERICGYCSSYGQKVHPRSKLLGLQVPRFVASINEAVAAFWQPQSVSIWPARCTSQPASHCRSHSLCEGSTRTRLLIAAARHVRRRGYGGERRHHGGVGRPDGRGHVCSAEAHSEIDTAASGRWRRGPGLAGNRPRGEKRRGADEEIFGWPSTSYHSCGAKCTERYRDVKKMKLLVSNANAESKRDQTA